jgi:hypothetical protein
LGLFAASTIVIVALLLVAEFFQDRRPLEFVTDRLMRLVRATGILPPLDAHVSANHQWTP